MTNVLWSIPSPAQGVWYVGPLPLRGYALCIVLGIVVAVWLGERRWRERGGQKDEVVDLALIEVLECGRGQVQVDRRLLVLLDDLIADVGPSLRPVLVSYRDQVRVADRLVTGRARAIARVGDRQGLGGSG